MICKLNKPKQDNEIKGYITNKRTNSMSMNGWGTFYYITVEGKEVFVPVKIYQQLSIGDYISATYRRGGISDEYTLIKLLERR